MAEAVLGLGGNLGARRSIFGAAAQLLAATASCTLLARSRLYETPPLGPPQPDYLNAALRVRYDGDVLALFAATQRVEQLLGRERRERWGARTLDIDLLHWSEGPVQHAQLEVPHRELAQRSFALAPLLDVAPELASVWGPVLHARGGAPALALPSWLALRREGDAYVSEWGFSDVELIALALDFAAAATHPAARAVEVRPFRARARVESDRDLSWIAELLERSRRAGFMASGAAVTQVEGADVSGCLLGEPVSEFALHDPPAVHLELDQRRRKRVRILGGKSDDGFVSRGSVTM